LLEIRVWTFSDLDLVAVSEPLDGGSRKSGDLALKLQLLPAGHGQLQKTSAF
jgi:hypothetical protein